MDGTRVSGYGLSVIRSLRFFTTLLGALLGVGAGGDDFASALERAREAGISHRYAEVIEILTPFNAVEDSETRYITAAEIGRAFYHLGRYREAHRAFREAVRLHPERAETAIYLEATSYLVGDTVQAYTILREILRSGARDLYLAVTLLESAVLRLNQRCRRSSRSSPSPSMWMSNRRAFSASVSASAVTS